MTESPSQIFARRIREIRKSRAWSQEVVARRLMELEGKRTDDPGLVESNRVLVARAEAGKRPVSIDDAVRFGAVLGVSPLALFLAPDEDTLVAVAPTLSVPAGLAYQWLAGYAPLRSSDITTYRQHEPAGPHADFFPDRVHETLVEGDGGEEFREVLRQPGLRAVLDAFIWNDRRELRHLARRFPDARDEIDEKLQRLDQIEVALEEKEE